MTAVADAERWVADRGLLGPGPVAGELLAGGVSCDVVAVTGPAGALVVKHAGPYLRVAEEWATWHREEYRALDDRELFEQLRLDPYLVTCQARRPEHADALQRVLDRLRGRRDCLVHGDFSPKNVLVGEGGLWVLDHEVGHIGDPQFDLAFMLSHLVLKAVHRPDRAAAYRACGEAFLGAYAGAAPGAGTVDEGERV